MANYLATASIDVVPLFVGTGIQNKVLEAMAMAKPVVSTSLGVEPFKVTPGKEVMVAETFNEFAGRIIWLLRNPFQARKIGIAARKYVERNHQWKDKVFQLEEVYSQVMI
jgi:glycosyltransferase involved in cell wall biosynthesis